MQRRLTSVFIFVAYIVVLIRVMVFKDIPTIRIGQLMLNFGGTTYDTHPANVVPFTTIVPYLLGSHGWIIAGVNLIGNIVPLIPLGFLLPFAFRNMTWKKSLVIAISAGLTIETMQTVLHVGIFDIDDVILNVLGVMIGYWTFLLIAKWMREKKYLSIGVAAIVVIAVATLAVSLIYPWGRPLVNTEVGANGAQSGTTEGALPQSGDLCGGTGGTGQIVSQGENSITIKRQDGVLQTLDFTAQTTVRNSSGAIAESDLKIGDHVTVVVNDHKTASVVLVCNN